LIKCILVPTDGSEFAELGVRYAISLAKSYNAKIVALHVIDIKLLEGPFLRDISVSLGTAPYLNYQGNITALLEERGKAALELVRGECRAAAVPCETILMTGIVSRCIIERSELSDLIVLGRAGEHGQWMDGLVGSTTAAVVRRAKRPVLVTGTDTLRNRQFVVAYDGSAHARRAMQFGAEFGATWNMPAHILVVGDEDSRHLLDEARDYLENYALKVNYILRQGDPSEGIVEYCEEVEADLLVMGAYGHTKVRELVVGSTTAYALNHAPCPLLLAR
jgi:nucleotide-binding universal stress UspA family protein